MSHFFDAPSRPFKEVSRSDIYWDTLHGGGVFSNYHDVEESDSFVKKYLG